MHRYFIKTPWIAKFLFPAYVWDLPAAEGTVYLTFDDGPHPRITPWVLDVLRDHDAKATFFCIGNNVAQFPEVYRRILDEGHATGNHTYDHCNGWKTPTDVYLRSTREAARLIDSNLFRPPYGRIRSAQAAGIAEAMGHRAAKVIMWDVLSADFDSSFSPQQCLKHVLDNVHSGSIVVFHDSEKAARNLEFILPEILKSLKERGYICRPMEMVCR
ncbi:MAG TPA: polysaccharide deacetylase family protein [Flavisolibacter sp.]